ncbi:hypothetical protein [Dyella sp. 20L07]|uniref:hypothetical protein n=1 Tax=Dyella sp. 20L07 TaxID=3384240 RepID=UPI003D2B60DA
MMAFLPEADKRTAALPLRALSSQAAAAMVLVVLMVCTRGQHMATVNALPSASWAVFFLAGLLLRPAWMFALLFGLATALDFGSYASGTITDWCLSPAYWVLIPAYGSLWLAGRIYAGMHRSHWSTLPRLACVLVVAAFVAYLVSGGGYYVFSGHYQPTVAGFLPRIAHYYPRSLGTMSGYIAVVVAAYEAIHWGMVRWSVHAQREVRL